MLTVVVLAVVATIQVECAPNQLWPAFDKVSEQSTKKPILAASVNKEKSSKILDPSATHHAYEQFIQTWLRQASITLNRPDILNLLPSSIPSGVVDAAEPVVGEADVPTVNTEDLISPVPASDFHMTQTEDYISFTEAPLTEAPLTEAPLPAKLSVATEGTASQFISVADELMSEPSLVPAETVEYSPEAAEVVGDVSPLNEEVLVPFAEQVPSSATQETASSPVVEDVMITPVEEIAADPIPSLVEQDTATVLVASPSIPLADAEFTSGIIAELTQRPLFTDQLPEILEPSVKPKAESESLSMRVSNQGKSFSSVQHETLSSPFVLSQPTQNPVPFAPAFPVARLPVGRPDVVNTDGLAYTLQFFPTRGLSHYFISTPIGG
ncbi:uncharacterized protein [Palaemon carinicauda]|uniref:uncharacterized protein n=1 Tax=Palaemon carinicauda TaxID=392227 RepID=UPI0035B5F89D